ncbi:DNA polymerase I A, chloroplastic-like isoform X1 [Canna indica]|uniref:DNA-directed DNA polymerase n=1 Tax=Canna indica TaxID=4628 RepID=A0AAQ3KCX2_9LILI|nr:DNA polymerase I A, chloroplastic-like isoform X1 [Canna indica]
MAIGVSTRGAVLRPPCSSSSSLWFSSYICRVISYTAWPLRVGSSSCTASLLWLKEKDRMKFYKVVQKVQQGLLQGSIPLADIDTKMVRRDAELGLVDGKEDECANNLEDAFLQNGGCMPCHSPIYSGSDSVLKDSSIEDKNWQFLSAFSPSESSRSTLPEPKKSSSGLQDFQDDHLATVAKEFSYKAPCSNKKMSNVHHVKVATKVGPPVKVTPNMGPPVRVAPKVGPPVEVAPKADPPVKVAPKAAPPVKVGTTNMVNREKLARIYEKVLVVNNISTAKEVVRLLTTTYQNLVHACDTEVANIDVKSDTPVGHGEIICFSIYSGPQADFGEEKSCIWVDVLDGGKDVLMEFVPFFEDPSIKKVWHNYSFDSHMLRNYGINLSGFYADTMHLARLWDSSRKTEGGYSLEALTSNRKVMSLENLHPVDELVTGKISMKSIFGKNKLKKDGSEGKLITLNPVDILQREERILWICYSAMDSISTLKLYNNLKAKLAGQKWTVNGVSRGTMYDFYEEYWRPFGALLVQMESEGMLVDRNYLKEMEKLAIVEKERAAKKFRKWASKYCEDAKFMNVGSDTQIRQLLFGGIVNSKDYNEFLPESKSFKVLNTAIEEGKKSPKYRTIQLHNICSERLHTDMYTASGWPSMSGDALKVFAGKVSMDQVYLDDDEREDQSDYSPEISDDQSNTEDIAYGTAYKAFGGGKQGREACEAIAALCEVCSIDSLISNFLLPLQGNHISCANGRIHCSLNINTETGRLSARRPNLQNQPALEKDRYKIRQAFIAEPGKSLIVADYGQLELRILAHLANCQSMLDAFKAGGDFHSRTAMNMYAHVHKAVEEKRVLLEWHPQPGTLEPPVPLLKDVFAAERRKAKMLNFSIAYGKTPVGLSRDWKVSVKEAKKTVELWYKRRQEVLKWQEEQKEEARINNCVRTLLGRSRRFPKMDSVSNAQRGHIERAAINTPVQGSAADVAMCAMLEIDRNVRLKELGWKLLLQVHDEVILEGPTESAEVAKAIVVECMSKPFNGTNFLKVDLAVDAKCAQNWYAAK